MAEKGAYAVMDLLVKPVWQHESSEVNQTVTGTDSETVLDDTTMCVLCIQVNNILISRIVDEEQQSHDGPRVSAYRFAEWLVWNWWRLRWEPSRSGPSELTWRQAHETASIGGGWLWPRITFASDGRMVSVRSSGSEPTVTEPITYVADNAENFVSAATFETSIDSFVIDVINRLKRKDLSRNLVSEMWRELNNEREDPDLALYRRLEALLGNNPDEGDVEVIRQLMKDREVFGEHATDEIAAELPVSSEVSVSAKDLFDLARISGFEVKDDDVTTSPMTDNTMTMMKADQSGSLVPWKIGQEAAKVLRNSEGLGEGRITNPLLSALCGLPKQALTKPSKVKPPISYSWTSENSKHIVLRARVSEGRRFDAARLLADKLLVRNGESMQPATSTQTFRQKMQRAFAAELLCPYEALFAKLEGDYSEDSIEAAGRHFMVSPMLVASTLENNGIPAYRGSKYAPV